MNKYQKNLTVLALLIFSAIMSSHAEEAPDGNWWRALQKEAKAGYVTGMTDGVYIGVAMLGKATLEKLDITPNPDVMDLLHKNPRGLFGDVKVGPIIDAIDRFYSDVRNRSIPTYYVVKMQIASTPDEQIRSMWTQEKNR
jgi:hypothetical protein